MLDLEFRKDQVPLWKGTNGKLVVKTSLPEDSLTLTPGMNPVLDTSWSLEGGNEFTFGSNGTVQLGLSASTKARIVPIWKDQFGGAADLVDRFQLQDALLPDNVLLACQFGGEGTVDAESSFKYSVLSASAALKAGTDASYVYIRSFPRTATFAPMLEETFGGMRFPDQIQAPPLPGEVVVFEYGGYLQFSARASAGYQIKGTKSLEIREIKLSEHYTLAVVGSLGVTSSLAGHYSIEVRAAAEPDWARVVVRRSRSKDLGVAADLKVNASLTSEGLPRSGKEFLGALLGTNSKNWLNLIDDAAGKADSITSIDSLKSRLDTLATSFIDRYAGKALQLLDSGEVEGLLSRLNKVVASYRTLDDSAIALVDRFLDPLADRLGELTSHLDTLSRLTSWDELKGEVNPVLWNTIRQLTDGDPLGWILGRTLGQEAALDAFRDRVRQAQSLIHDSVHEELRNIIRLAKSEFGVDHFFNILDSIDTKEELKTTLPNAAKGFVQRLIGRTVDSLDERDLKKVFKLVKQVAAGREQFWNDFDRALQNAAVQKLSIGISAAYKSASDRSALIDVDVRLRRNGEPFAPGQQMLRAAAHGNFMQMLNRFQPEVVRIHEGVLTSRLSQESSVIINIAGWHRNFDYSAAFRVVTQSRQQIRTTLAGGMTVFTQVDMSSSSERRRKRTKSEERMTTNFLLRYLGETRGAIAASNFDQDDVKYAIDVITSQTAQYESTFTDSDTSETELREYLAFAKALNLEPAGAALEAIAPLIRKQGSSYGAVSGEYDVQFTETGLKQLFSIETTDAQVRTVLRRIVLANYIGKGSIAEVAALYAADKVRELYEAKGPNFIGSESILGEALRNRQVRPENVIPGIRFPSVANKFATRVLVAGLLDIERDLIEAFGELKKILTSGGAIPLEQFESRLQKFGKALNRFDNRDLGDNSVFAVIDGLIALRTPVTDARSSALTLTFTGTDGQPKLLLFTSHAVKAAAA